MTVILKHSGIFLNENTGILQEVTKYFPSFKHNTEFLHAYAHILLSQTLREQNYCHTDTEVSYLAEIIIIMMDNKQEK